MVYHFLVFGDKFVFRIYEIIPYNIHSIHKNVSPNLESSDLEIMAKIKSSKNIISESNR